MTKPLAVVVLLAPLALLACGRADQQKSDKTNAADNPNTPRVASVAAARSAAAALPGALSKAIDQYTGDELYAFAHGLTFTGGNERERRCRGNSACQGAAPGQRTRVRVDAVDQQDSLSAGTVPPNGVIAVRANNTGTLADSMYNMKSGARYEYYLIVLPAAAGTATWRLEELDVTRGSRAHHSVASGVIHECNHPFVRGARADFKSCATAATVRPASFGAFQDSPEEPIWYGCSTGCCTADANDGRA